MASLAAELGGSNASEVEMAQSLSMVTEEGDPEAALHNGNGLLPAPPLSSGGRPSVAAAASAAEPQRQQDEQQQRQQQPHQQREQAEQHAVSGAASSGNAQLPGPASPRHCCGALKAFWTDLQVSTIKSCTLSPTSAAHGNSRV